MCCRISAIFVVLLASVSPLAAADPYDVLIRGGMVYDGSGKAPKRADVALKGDSHNVASFVGATTVREIVLGNENKKPTAEELERMKRLVEIEMKDGALGVGTALEYAPSYYADTEELIELCKVAAKYQGKYI